MELKEIGECVCHFEGESQRRARATATSKRGNKSRSNFNEPDNLKQVHFYFEKILDLKPLGRT